MTTHFMDKIREERLAQARPPQKPWKGKEPERTHQRKLLDGLECLRGQLDLPFNDAGPCLIVAAKATA
jgi:hypothetical protein